LPELGGGAAVFLQIGFAIPSNRMTVARTVSPISRRTPETLFRPKRMFGI
jgi:hypothetical protein